MNVLFSKGRGLKDLLHVNSQQKSLFFIPIFEKEILNEKYHVLFISFVVFSE